MKKEYFKVELSRIENDNVRKGTEYILDNLPDYFYEVSACPSGKHHPAFAQGEKGLIRHVKVAALFLESILDNKTFGEFTPYEKDLMRMAVLLHDGFKEGWNFSGKVAFDHPLIMSRFLWENKDKLDLPQTDVCRVCRLIESHMGPFVEDEKGYAMLPVPQRDDEKAVHCSDYMASQRFLNIIFKDGEIVVDTTEKPMQPELK